MGGEAGDYSLIKSAIIIGDYRYELRRVWDETLPPYVIIMLNPSTADHLIDDPTIVRCVERARRLGYCSIIVGNAFALRNPNSEALFRYPNPIGPANNLHLRRIFLECKRRKGIAVAGWGTHGGFMQRHKNVLELADAAGIELHCLGTTKQGHPLHPLYVSYAQPLIKWANQ